MGLVWNKCGVLRNNPSTAIFPFPTAFFHLVPPSSSRESATVPQPDQSKSRLKPSNRQVFLGIFCLWAKPFRPPEVLSVASGPVDGDDSGGLALVVADQATTADDPAHLTSLKGRDGWLRRCLDGGGNRGQRHVALPLVRSS